MKRTTTQGYTARCVIIHLFLIFGLLQAILPFLWMISSSLMTTQESISIPITIIPSKTQWVNYITIFKQLHVIRLLLNSILMTSGVVLTQLIFCSLAGFAFAKIKFPFKNIIFISLMSILMIPSNMFLIPQYLIVAKMHLLNTITGLILPGAFSIFGTFFMRQCFMQIDSAIEEAAVIDGCNRLKIYWYIMLPLVRPGLATLAIIDGIWAWNNLLWPLILNSDPNKMTLASQLATFSGQYNIEYPLVMAGAFISIMPMIILFFIFQKQFIGSIAVIGRK